MAQSPSRVARRRTPSAGCGGGASACVAAAATYLASDDGRYVSGHTLVVDAGQTMSGMTPNRMNRGSTREIHEAGRTS